MFNKKEFIHRIPHSGKMFLIDKVLSFDEKTLFAETKTHIDSENPLLENNILSSMNGIEYAAQAVAIHKSFVDKCTQKEGYLISVRGVKTYVEDLVNTKESLQINVKSLLSNNENATYSFTIIAGKQLLLEGRLTILIKETDSEL